jgi:hypothetical protein
MQLAYVFAHAPGAATSREEYVAGLQQFHDALAAAPPNGFLDSWVWHVAEAAPAGSFEDWYLVEDWTALGALNAAAVTGARKAPHDAVAPLAGAGAGGIYALAYGHPASDAGYRLRIDKPATPRSRRTCSTWSARGRRCGSDRWSSGPIVNTW